MLLTLLSYPTRYLMKRFTMMIGDYTDDQYLLQHVVHRLKARRPVVTLYHDLFETSRTSQLFHLEYFIYVISDPVSFVPNRFHVEM